MSNKEIVDRIEKEYNDLDKVKWYQITLELLSRAFDKA